VNHSDELIVLNLACDRVPPLRNNGCITPRPTAPDRMAGGPLPSASIATIRSEICVFDSPSPSLRIAALNSSWSTAPLSSRSIARKTSSNPSTKSRDSAPRIRHEIEITSGERGRTLDGLAV
jgi:hypothetical protein